MKKRLSHIDNAKAIGMMLIIASHIIPSEIIAPDSYTHLRDQEKLLNFE